MDNKRKKFCSYSYRHRKRIIQNLIERNTDKLEDTCSYNDPDKKLNGLVPSSLTSSESDENLSDIGRPRPTENVCPNPTDESVLSYRPHSQEPSISNSTNELCRPTLTDTSSLEANYLFDSTDSTFTESQNSSISDQETLLPVTGTQTDNPIDFKTSLTQWAVSNKIKKSAFSSLIKVLKTHPCHSELPYDPRTLVKTPRNCITRDVSPGIYYHFGLKNQICKYIEDARFEVNRYKGVELAINIDGLPISRSSTNAFWPILGSLIPTKDVFIVGVYYGPSKPANVHEYLQEFIDEAVTLTETGIKIDDGRPTYEFRIQTITCDAPAKAYLLCTKSHTGYSSCPKCYVVGEYLENRVCFPSINDPLRTNEDFLNHKDEDYHLSESPLERIPNIQLVSNVPFDYMHVVCLGVVRKMISLWLGHPGPLNVRITSRKMEVISDLLEKVGRLKPKEFVRRARSLKFFKLWKATELRQFLLYYGPVILKNVIDKPVYDNFVTLHVSVRILSSKHHLSCHSDYAQELMEHFVTTFIILYKEFNVSHNVHALIHLSEDAKRFGVLDNFSAFKFENFLQGMKKKLHKSEKPLQQLVKRYLEELQNMPNANIKYRNKSCSFEVVKTSQHTNGPLSANCKNLQFSAVRNNQMYLDALNEADNCCGLQGGKIILVKNFAKSPVNDSTLVIGYELLPKDDLYLQPCPSTFLGICIVNETKKDLSSWPVNDITCKYMRIPYLTDYVVVPILHNDL